MIYRIELPHACGGLVIENNKVKASAPIFSWMIGKTISEVTKWVNKKGGKIEVV